MPKADPIWKLGWIFSPLAKHNSLRPSVLAMGLTETSQDVTG
jgi:hypothetical protein